MKTLKFLLLLTLASCQKYELPEQTGRRFYAASLESDSLTFTVDTLSASGHSPVCIPADLHTANLSATHEGRPIRCRFAVFDGDELVWEVCCNGMAAF